MSQIMVKNPNKQTPKNNVYRWNFLPDDIIANILSRITPSKGYQFTVSPNIYTTTLDIKIWSYINTSQLWNTVENIITIFTSPSTVCRLQLSCVYFPNSSESFINSLTRHLILHNNIRHFEITILGGKSRCSGEVEAENVFQMNSLVSLDMDLSKYGFAWKLPRWINLPNLKKLAFISMDFSDLERLVRCCPSLEDLTITFVKDSKGYLGNVMVSTKKLKRLRLSVHWFSYLEVIIDAPNLDHLDLGSRWKSIPFALGAGGGCGDLCLRTIDSISYVKSVVLNLDTPPTLYNSPSKTYFPNLTHLTLKLGSFERFEALGTEMHCPNLEVVVLKVTYFRWKSLVRNTVTFGLFKHVKRLELNMKHVRFEKQLLSLAMYLLASTPVLATFSLRAKRSCESYNVGRYEKVEEGEFIRSLISMVSPRCQIELLGAYKTLNRFN